MDYKPSRGFIEDIVRLACICDENDTDSMDIGFTLKDWGTDGVIAWMETPEPYKEDDNDTH